MYTLGFMGDVMLSHRSFSNFVAGGENLRTVRAIECFAAAIHTGQIDTLPNPLMLHGPSGSGKSHLVSALIDEVTRGTSLIVHALAAASLPRQHTASSEPDGDFQDRWRDMRECDLLVLEDLQHLPCWAWEPLVQLIDNRL